MIPFCGNGRSAWPTESAKSPNWVLNRGRWLPDSPAGEARLAAKARSVGVTSTSGFERSGGRLERLEGQRVDRLETQAQTRPLLPM